MDPSFIDAHRGVDTSAVRCIVTRTMTFNRASQSMMNYSMRSRGGVAVVLFFFSFFLFPVFLFPFVYSFISRRFIDSGREPTGRLTANNLLALPCLPLSAAYIRVQRENVYIRATRTRYTRDISV